MMSLELSLSIEYYFNILLRRHVIEAMMFITPSPQHAFVPRQAILVAAAVVVGVHDDSDGAGVGRVEESGLDGGGSLCFDGGHGDGVDVGSDCVYLLTMYMTRERV